MSIKNDFEEKTTELIPEKCYGYMFHLYGSFDLAQKLEAWLETQLIQILEKLSVLLDISYNTLTIPHHSLQSIS